MQLNLRRKTFNPFLTFLAIGSVLVVMTASEIYDRAKIEIAGQIVAKQTSCQQPRNNRCSTIYTVAAQDGSKQLYVAGPTYEALSHDLPIGAFLRKEKWRFDYVVDGSLIQDFPLVFSLGLLAIGLAAVGVWFINRRTALQAQH